MTNLPERKSIKEFSREFLENIKDKQAIEEVEEFANILINIGQKFKLPVLCNYGNQLLKTIDNFDIEKMLELINNQ